ncbi:MAG: P-loop NTPase [Myxococcota bacterium]
MGILDADLYGPSLPTMLGAHERARVPPEEYLLPVEAHGLKTLSIGSLVGREAESTGADRRSERPRPLTPPPLVRGRAARVIPPGTTRKRRAQCPIRTRRIESSLRG